MGHMKTIAIELDEMEELNVHEDDYVDSEIWWEMLDDQMVQDELNDRMEALEIEAEIWELRAVGAT